MSDHPDYWDDATYDEMAARIEELEAENGRQRTALRSAEAVVKASRWCCGGTRLEEGALRAALDAYDDATKEDQPQQEKTT